jgi:hypothetical protein
VIDFCYGRPLYTLPVGLGITSSLCTFLFWLQTSEKVKDSLNMKISVRRVGVRRTALVISLIVIVVDVVVSVGSVYGTIVGDSTAIPVILFLIFDLALVVAIFVVRIFLRTYIYIMNSRQAVSPH